VLVIADSSPLIYGTRPWNDARLRLASTHSTHRPRHSDFIKERGKDMKGADA
jgi:hypothetical protein